MSETDLQLRTYPRLLQSAAKPKPDNEWKNIDTINYGRNGILL